jgi:MYXO-CTERM domain-containing protein
MSYPPSNASQKYVITLNGVTTLTFDFAPVAPDGFGAFTSPTHESATADTTPTFTFTNACTNCNAQVVFVEDTGFSTIDIQNFVLGPPFPSMLELSDFENDDGPPVTELPFDDYEACISTAVGTIDGLVSMGGQNFGLIRAGVAEDCIEFTVPEPGSGALGAAVLATLAVLRRRRTGRPGARIP